MNNPTKKLERPFRFAVSKLDMAKVIVQSIFGLDRLPNDSTTDPYEKSYCFRLERLRKSTLAEMRRMAGLICEFKIDRGYWPTNDELAERRQLELYLVAAKIFGYCYSCDNILPMKWRGRNYRCDNCGTITGQRR